MEGQSIVNVDEIHRAARFFAQPTSAICTVPVDQMPSAPMCSISFTYRRALPDISGCAYHDDVRLVIEKGDVVLVVTHSGRTSDIKSAVELAKKNGAKIICITHSYHSPIAKLADFIICSPAPETPLLGRNASARILQLTLLDAFFVSVAQQNIEQATLNMQNRRHC